MAILIPVVLVALVAMFHAVGKMDKEKEKEKEIEDREK